MNKCILTFIAILFASNIFSHTANAQVTAYFNCAEPVYSNGNLVQIKSYFGYYNSSASNVVIQSGINNFVSPPSSQNDPPTTFLPGYHEKAFFTTISYPNRATWFLNNQIVSSSINPANFCGAGAITYQGRLTNANAAANGLYDLQFSFYEFATGGAAHPKILKVSNVQVTNGVFTVSLDVNAIFLDGNRLGFVEIGVKPAQDTHPYTILAPRQPISSVPYALNARSVSGGMVQLPLNVLISPPDCSKVTDHGKMSFNAYSNELFICSASGWKKITLQ